MLTQQEVESLRPSEVQHNRKLYFFDCKDTCICVWFTFDEVSVEVFNEGNDSFSSEVYLPTINTLDKLVALLSLLERLD